MARSGHCGRTARAQKFVPSDSSLIGRALLNMGLKPGRSVTPKALPVVTRGLGNDQRRFDGIAQPNQPVAKLGAAVKHLDFILQVAQFTDGPRKPVAGTDQPNVVPHDILDGLHIALDQRRVRILCQPALIPDGDIVRSGHMTRAA